ncbi:MAG: invasion associated locus B family protein [Pseudomonadota bacterium]
MRHFVSGMLALVLAATTMATQAEQQAAGTAPAQRVEATFGDWSRICSSNPEGATVCQIVQSANQNESGQLVFQTAVGYVADNERPIMYLTAPLGIFLPRGISIFVDDSEEGLTATVQRCDGSGCLGLLAMTEAFVDKLKKGKAAKLVFGATATQNVSLPLSLDGFTKAFNSLVPLQQQKQ